jgi:DNA adenine methylase
VCGLPEFKGKIEEMIKHPLLRYFGSKFRLAPWIISHFPEHEIYVDAFGGAAGVLLRKPRINNEVFNDLDGEIFNLFQVLRNPTQSHKLIEQIELTPFHRAEYFSSHNFTTQDPIERARCLIARSFMSYSSSGTIKCLSGFSGSCKKGKTTDATVWAKIPHNLAMICKRLKGVIIENQPALKLIQMHDSNKTLFYLDPPYLPETRTSKNIYQYEMTFSEHELLLKQINNLKGKVVISGYDCELYNDYLVSWVKKKSFSRAAGQKGTVIRTECIWIKK